MYCKNRPPDLCGLVLQLQLRVMHLHTRIYTNTSVYRPEEVNLE